jgi:uncharacterized protein with beta-barrel porin domain
MASSKQAGLIFFRKPALFGASPELWGLPPLVRIAAVAAALSAAAPATVLAGPDPCTGVGVVTCSGNQSAGVGNPPPGTTVLNVNSLTTDIAPPLGSGQPGILFFGSGDITLNNATSPYRIIVSDDFVDGIVAQSDGAVTVTTSGNIAIRGAFASGINLLSFAGGTITLTSSSAISLANGGNGILAYSDGDVALTSSGALSVTGDGTGINATAGAHVSVNSSGAISITGDGDAIDASDIGGPAGGGGVNVVSSGAISLAGNAANGIFAYSEATDPVNVNSSSRISLTHGGTGISALSLGDITVNASGDISVAGGAGAGIAAGSGQIGAVNVKSSGAITLAGDGVAIIAAAAGGAATVTSTGNIQLGGSGLGISAIGVNGASVNASGSISLGGGGNAINAIAPIGDASVTASGGISIRGDGAGIGAVSVSGAGRVNSSGNVFIGGSGTGIDAEGNVARIDAASGISVGKDGTGIQASGTNGVTVNASGMISIGGRGDAIAAVSVNGAATIGSSAILSIGNGNGIDAVSAGAAANVTASGSIFIGGSGSGIEAQGNLVQVNAPGNISIMKDGTGIEAAGATGASVSSSGGISIGGNGNAIDAVSMSGGANVASAGNISIGGSGTGINARGSLVQVDSSGDISVANGGTGINASGRISTVNATGSIFIQNGGAGIAISGKDGANLKSSGAISIAGNGNAISAASVGANTSVASSANISLNGSGTGISAVGGGTTITSSSSIAIANTGSGIAATGGTLVINSTGNISVGAGGSGIAALGGDVAVNSSGNISVAGGLGTAGIGAFGDTVAITAAGNVSTPGNDASAITAGSLDGNLSVNITRGQVTGGSGTGAGIVLAGGANNTLANFGTITTSAGLAGTAILGSPIPVGTGPPIIGNNTVDNAGTVIGNVDLGPGRNAFNNLAGGTFDTGAAIKLGAGNVLTNNGNLSPGGAGVIQATALTGNLVQAGNGRITVDFNPASGQADRLDVSGAAQLAGQVVVNPSATSIPTMTTAFTIVHADGGVTNNGITLSGADLFNSAVATPELEFPDPNTLVFQIGVNFAPTGLNRNQTAIGRDINSIQLAGSSPGFLPVAQALVTIPNLEGLAQAYDQLSPETYADNRVGDFYSGLRFADSLMSCKVPDGRYAFIKEGQCVWAQVGGGFLDLDRTSGSLGFHQSAARVSGGAEIMLRPDWFAGVALGYAHGFENTESTLATSQSNSAHFGGVVKYNPGPFLFAAAVYGGYGWYSTDRFIDFAGFNAIATSDSRISRVGGQLRAEYLAVDRGAWYLKPLVDLNLTRVGLAGFSEQGAGGANLVVAGTDTTVFSGSPAVEIGSQMNLPDGALLRPFARAGLTAFNTTDFGVSASFASAPAGTAPFRVTTGIDTVTADIALGADFLSTQSGWGLKLAYSGHYGARVRDQGFRLKADMRF